MVSFSRSSSSLVLIAALAQSFGILQGCTPAEKSGETAGAAGASGGSSGGSAGESAGGSEQGGSGGSAGSQQGGEAGSSGEAGQGGAGGGEGGTSGASGSGGTGQTATDLVVLKPGAKLVDAGSEVLESNLDGIPPYSSGVIDLTLKNNGSSPLLIESVSLIPQEPALALEWRISKAGSTGYDPIQIENITLGPGEATSFAGFFSPIASGPRKTTVEIKHSGGQTFSFTLAGRGRDNAELSSKVSATQERIFGDPAADLLTGGMVSDAEGNVWASANATQWKDNFTQNIAVYQVKNDGSLGWARVWNEPFDQRQPDPGQNAESGGGADCIAADATHLYLVGRRSLNNSNSLFQTLVFKVDKATGAIAWAKGISMNAGPEPKVAADSSEAYSVDARHADRILVTGNGGNAQAATGFVTLFALDKATGELIFDQLIDVVAGSQDRGHSIVSDGAGNAYIGGLANGKAMLLRVTEVNTTTPKLAWVKQVNLGVGGNINSLDIDPSGDVYASMDRRGATTFLSFGRISKDGALLWGKTWDDQNTGDSNNSYVVRYHDGGVFFGGRVAINPFDTQYADGFFMAANGADGAYRWASFYYTGKGAEEMTEHRVKGIGFGADGSARTLLQSYTNGLNFEHYWGFWYQAPDYTKELPAGDGSKRYADYAPELTDLGAQATITDAPSAAAHAIDTTELWVSPQETAVLSSLDTRTGNGGDGSSVIQSLKLSP